MCREHQRCSRKDDAFGLSHFIKKVQRFEIKNVSPHQVDPWPQK